ncbi:MAG TPA: hypothetical protein RMI62_17600, partial [Polyangiaceae bacterium LLY-WYZ-15_(1-7)]|nr:hypothetical protein [Polyangiaceae bacterium LLY-WYZ-15_(1-7)]
MVFVTDPEAIALAPSHTELRALCAAVTSSLPRAAAPAAVFVQAMGSLPLLPNGKLDRLALAQRARSLHLSALVADAEEETLAED